MGIEDVFPKRSHSPYSKNISSSVFIIHYHTILQLIAIVIQAQKKLPTSSTANELSTSLSFRFFPVKNSRTAFPLPPCAVNAQPNSWYTKEFQSQTHHFPVHLITGWFNSSFTLRFLFHTHHIQAIGRGTSRAFVKHKRRQTAPCSRRPSCCYVRLFLEINTLSPFTSPRQQPRRSF